jgi:hypothetical protein
MLDSFAVHLGGGLYLDASGNLVFGAPTNAQIYHAPKGYSVDLKKIQGTFKDLAGLLPKDEAGKKEWKDWGVPPKLVESLSKLAGIVGTTATFVSIYLWGVGAMISLMSLMSSDDGMSPEMGRVLTNLKNQMKGLEEIVLADTMISIHSEFDGRIDRVNGKLTNLAVQKPVGAARVQLFADITAIVDELAVPLSRLRNQEWATTYDPDAYKGRFSLSPRLVFVGPGGVLTSVPPVAPGLTMFNYRLGVPMLLFGTTTFAALARIAMPWFRSAGIYAEQLRKSADALDRFVLRMQSDSLARTEHSPQSIMQEQLGPTMQVPALLDGPLRPSPIFPRYPVGAFDLVSYNDNFLNERRLDAFVHHTYEGRRGTFDYTWQDSAYPARPPNGLSLEKIAEEANDRSRQDYADLQTATGSFRLITAAAWLRFLSTPPDRSETVAGTVEDTRRLVDSGPTIARSPTIFPLTTVEYPATLRRYEAHSRLQIGTQEPGYIPSFSYRVVLRTLKSVADKEGWHRREYVGDVWQADYEPAQADKRCNRLRTTFRQDVILSEVVLHDGPSPEQPLKTPPNRAPLRASTFDWYVPVVQRGSAYLDVTLPVFTRTTQRKGTSGASKPLVAAGGDVSIHLAQMASAAPAPLPILGGPGPAPSPLHFSAEATLETGTISTEFVPDLVERRHVRDEDVELEWQLSWNAGRLDISLSGRPTDRPFQVFVVIEENVYSGEDAPAVESGPLSDPLLREHLHTPFASEIVNQIVFVPEEFFKAERAALDQGEKLWHDFVTKFAKSTTVGPGTPVASLLDAVANRLLASPSTATLAAVLDERINFAGREHPKIWGAILKGAGIEIHLDQSRH